MTNVRQVRLFRNGRNQALRIPKDFELPGSSATVRKIGTRLIIEPLQPSSLLEVLATLMPLPPGHDFPNVDETLLPLDEPLTGRR